MYCVLFAPGQGLSGVYVGIAAEYVDALVDAAEVVDGLKVSVSSFQIDRIHTMNTYLMLELALLVSSLFTGQEPCCT